MRLLWTKSKSIIGPLITWGLNSPVSHFAIEFHDGIIFHSNFLGINIMHTVDFLKQSEIVYSKKIEMSFADEAMLLSNIIKNYYGKRYDWKWFFSLTKAALKHRLFGSEIPDDIKSKSRDKYICTECVEFLEPVIGKVDIGNGSPYLLAQKLGCT